MPPFILHPQAQACGRYQTVPWPITEGMQLHQGYAADLREWSNID